jgi:serine/threonine protein kinase
VSFITGTKLESFEIIDLLGAGGMGEVYRARDTRLNRAVAIKVLPEAFANDPDRLARFQREGQVLAALSHPNIGVIHGIHESRGTRFLVLELVEGETLAARLKRGTVPLDEALGLLKQVAAALEAAHEKGILHRDLKPANIQITPDGVVKVLDFGLAKMFETEAAPVEPSNSPTLIASQTVGGAILGTAAYMSPEQARGRTVDKRTDVWAFGCDQLPSSWAAKNDSIVFMQFRKENSQIWVLPMDGERKPKLFLESRFTLRYPEFSPDGRWIAYVSSESGRDEVYVQPYPGPGEKHRVSTEGGGQLIWTANGRELLFRRSWQEFFSATITSLNPFRTEGPRLIFQSKSGGFSSTTPIRAWDVPRTASDSW